MVQQVKVDVAIIGGGIAGLWLLNQVRQEGYSATLFEANTLGGMQSVHSQGIIHSGVKYALRGRKNKSQQAISQMPAIWQSCLNGDGPVDLSKATVLSDHQYLWHQGSVFNRITSFFASKALTSSMSQLDYEDFPAVFQNEQFDGDVFQLNEPVLDIPSVIRALITPVKEDIYRYDWSDAQFELGHSGITHATLTTAQQDIELSAEYFIFTSGEGNERLLDKLGLSEPVMQRRPLHMVYVKGALPSLYAHAMQFGSKPRLTITTHPVGDGVNAWYLGGELAERGVDRNREQQIFFARKELETLFPWVDFTNTKWNSFFIDRAEMKQPRGQRPDTPCYHQNGNVIFAWPTKLAFAPLLSQTIMHECLDLIPSKNSGGNRDLEPLGKPQIADPQWMF